MVIYYMNSNELLDKLFKKTTKRSIYHGYHETDCMSGCISNHGFNMFSSSIARQWVWPQTQ